MNPAGAFIQIVLLIVSVVIGFTYLKPTFLDIQSLQDEKQRYIDERTRVDEVNRLLQSLVNEYESVSVDNLRKLNAYIPDSIDELEIMRTIMAVSEESEVNVESISIESSGTYAGSEDDDNNYQTGEFSVSLSGPYDNMKPFLARLERNASPLLVSNIEIGPNNNVNVVEEGADRDEYVSLVVSLVSFALPDITDEPN